MRMPCGHGQTVDAPCIGEVRAEDAKRWWACGRHVRQKEPVPSAEVRRATQKSKRMGYAMFLFMVREGERKTLDYDGKAPQVTYRAAAK